MASATYTSAGTRRLSYAHRWSDARVDAGTRQLHRVLAGVGDDTHERLAVGAIALFHSRLLTDQEVDASGLRGVCATDIAGAPVRVLLERGGPFSASTQPCERVAIGTDPELGIPRVMQCGSCNSCSARVRLESGVASK